MRNNRTRRFTYLAVLSAMAMMINMLETSLLPPFFGFFRLGLANIIALVTIRVMSANAMIVVNGMRVILGSLLSGRFLGSTFWIGAAGVVLSSLVCNRAFRRSDSGRHVFLHAAGDSGCSAVLYTRFRRNRGIDRHHCADGFKTHPAAAIKKTRFRRRICISTSGRGGRN